MGGREQVRLQQVGQGAAQQRVRQRGAPQQLLRLPAVPQVPRGRHAGHLGRRVLRLAEGRLRGLPVHRESSSLEE